MKHLKKLKLAVLTVFFLTFCSMQSFAQKKKPAKTPSSTFTTANKDICDHCKGKGKVNGRKPCSNCASWSDEYKSKVPCHTCKDTRFHGTAIQTCFFCEGTGKVKPFDDETKELLKNYSEKLQQKQQ